MTRVGTPRTPTSTASARIVSIRVSPAGSYAAATAAAASSPARSAARAICGVGRDVLALAEERLVERVLEGAEPSAVLGPQAGGERQRRARLEAREVDLDLPGERVAIDVVRPVGAEVVAADLEQGSRGRAKLEREPLDLGIPGVLGLLGGM